MSLCAALQQQTAFRAPTSDDEDRLCMACYDTPDLLELECGHADFCRACHNQTPTRSRRCAQCHRPATLRQPLSKMKLDH